jgi:hypothetical protein
LLEALVGILPVQVVPEPEEAAQVDRTEPVLRELLEAPLALVKAVRRMAGPQRRRQPAGRTATLGQNGTLLTDAALAAMATPQVLATAVMADLMVVEAAAAASILAAQAVLVFRVLSF